MGTPVAKLLDIMSVEELLEWMAFYRIEPFGFEIENFRAGVVAATVVNCTPRKRGAKPSVPSDFYPSTKSGPQLTERQKRELARRRATRGK